MDILALSNFLQEHSCKKDSLKEESQSSARQSNNDNITPASFGLELPKLHTHHDADNDEQQRVDDNEIWSSDEVSSILNSNANDDNGIDTHDDDIRPEPSYQISFKQEVGTEDLFLGSTDKTPGSFDCTHIVVKIHFPNATIDELNLDVKTTNCLFAESSDKKLSISLPLQVYNEDGNAQWDSTTEYLTVTLPVKQIFST